MTRMTEVRWAVVGPGRIAAKVVRDFEHVPGARLVAVGSRSEARATAFAVEHGADRAYGSYADLLDDDVRSELCAGPDLDEIWTSGDHLLVGSGGPHSEDVLARHLGLLTRMLRALRGTA